MLANIKIPNVKVVHTHYGFLVIGQPRAPQYPTHFYLRWKTQELPGNRLFYRLFVQEGLQWVETVYSLKITEQSPKRDLVKVIEPLIRDFCEDYFKYTIPKEIKNVAAVTLLCIWQFRIAEAHHLALLPEEIIRIIVRYIHSAP